jgi:hypothetical protein
MKTTLSNAQREELRGLWKALFRVEPPTEEQWDVWGIFHEADIVRDGLLQLALKYKMLGGEMSADHMYKFASAVMNRRSRDSREALARIIANKTGTGTTSQTPVPVTVTEENRWNR